VFPDQFRENERCVLRPLTISRDVNKLHTFSDQYLLQQNPHIPETTLNHRFEEIYVLAEVDWLKKQENVKKAIEERGLQVHAFVYEKEGNECVRLVESGRETVNNGVKI
jgi:carbonic anhydrase